MLRKVGLTTALLLALPAFANAWTLSAKIGSGAGSLTSDLVADKTVTKTVTGAPVIGYFKVADGEKQTITLSPLKDTTHDYTLSTVLVDGAKVTPTAAGDNYTVAVSSGKANHSLVVYYTAVGASLNLTQPANGGSITVQPLKADGTPFGAISRSGFSSLKTGAKVRLTATPNADYTFESLTFNGVAPDQILYKGAMGDVPYADVTIASGTNSATATFTAVPKVSARIAVGTAVTSVNGYAGWASSMNYKTNDSIPLDVTKTTKANTTAAIVYVLEAFNEDGLTRATGATFTGTTGVAFANVGTYIVKLTATAGTATSEATTPKIVVVSPATAAASSCTACHSNRNPTITDGFPNSVHYGLISCQGCHDAPHSSVATVAICVTCHKTPNAPREHTAALNACNTCHNSHTLGSIAGSITDQHTITITTSTCADCHVEHTGGTAFLKAQYVSTASLPVSCADCHGDWKTANQATLVQFAGSAHGDGSGEAWRHYDWRGANRSSCARCHTVTAFVAKLGKENDTSNVFLAGDVLKPGEVLACSACHTDAGALRTAAQDFAQTFTINMSNGATVTYDVAGASTLCARCHSGRETGASINADTDTTGVRVFVDSHYQPVAGTVYNKAGYEYAGQSYDGLGSHKLLGANSQGPCVTCHMSGKNHSFVAASCGTCHDGTTAPVVDAAALKADYLAALNNLKLALAAKGIHYGPVHPFFFTAPYLAGATNVPVTNWAAPYGAAGWKNTMGAAFNYNMLWSEKGAYAHNYDYAMKLIADSIDFMNDGAVDGR